MKIIVIALAATLAAIPLAHAQQTRNDLNQYNNQYITTNGQGEITGQQLNTILGNIINGAGILNDTNPWTGTNTFSGPVSFPGIPNVQHGDPIPATGQEYINSSGFHAIAQ